MYVKKSWNIYPLALAMGHWHICQWINVPCMKDYTMIKAKIALVIHPNHAAKIQSMNLKQVLKCMNFKLQNIISNENNEDSELASLRVALQAPKQ